MAKPNYSFEKRKKELERLKKKEEKKARKSEQSADDPEINGETETGDTLSTAE